MGKRTKCVMVEEFGEADVSRIAKVNVQLGLTEELEKRLAAELAKDRFGAWKVAGVRGGKIKTNITDD